MPRMPRLHPLAYQSRDDCGGDVCGHNNKRSARTTTGDELPQRYGGGGTWQRLAVALAVCLRRWRGAKRTARRPRQGAAHISHRESVLRMRQPFLIWQALESRVARVLERRVHVSEVAIREVTAEMASRLNAARWAFLVMALSATVYFTLLAFEARMTRNLCLCVRTHRYVPCCPRATSPRRHPRPQALKPSLIVYHS